jgi:hypothetical protein
MRTAVRRMRVGWPRHTAAVVALVIFFASAVFVQAQGFNGLSQLFGGGGSQQGQGFGGLSQLLGGGRFQHSQSSGQSGTSVTVERRAAPYMGEFTGKETTSDGPRSLRSRFACYPARDPAFAQTETFVCYAAETSAQPGMGAN